MFKPKNTPQFLVYAVAADPEKSIEFYRDVFRFELIDSPAKNESGEIIHAEMRFGEMVFMFCKEGAWGSAQKTPKSLSVSGPQTFYLYLSNVDDVYNHVQSFDVKIVNPIQDGFWGDRFFTVQDINGYEWSFATHQVKA